MKLFNIFWAVINHVLTLPGLGFSGDSSPPPPSLNILVLTLATYKPSVQLMCLLTLRGWRVRCEAFDQAFLPENRTFDLEALPGGAM